MKLNRIYKSSAIILFLVMLLCKTAIAGTMPPETAAGAVNDTPTGAATETASGMADETAAGTPTEMGYRIIPLQNELAGMSEDDINGYVNRFSDMKKHWSRQVVGKLTGLGIIAGMGDGRFDPDGALQADQFIKMAIMAMGHKIEQGTEYWAQPYIDQAIREGIISPGEITDYKKPLLREQMAKIIVLTALRMDGASGAKYDQYLKGKIADYQNISDNLKQYVLDAYKMCLLTGMGNGKFAPKATMTRAEASAVIIRILDNTERMPASPGPDEIIRLVDNLGNPMEIYPGTIKEYFEIEKAMEKALPKAKGYAILFYSPETGAVCVDVYRSYEAWQENCVENVIAAFQSNNSYKDPNNSFAYTFCVWQKEPYNELFADYIKEILKALYGKDADKATALHDKYLNIKTDKADGSNYWETLRMNDRYTEFVGGANGFSFFVRLKGEESRYYGGKK